MNELDPIHIQYALRRLHSSRAANSIFGAESHRFELKPTLSEAAVVAFEMQHRITLPGDYREFLKRVGNGGAGPYYGVFPLGQMDGTNGCNPWRENDGFVGCLSEPFLLASKWNDLTGMPSDELLASNEPEYERQSSAFESRYWNASLMNGAIPICHEGCALRIWLVVTGEQAGRLWHDGRADFAGVRPVKTAEGMNATFSAWYNEWLDEALRLIG